MISVGDWTKLFIELIFFWLRYFVSVSLTILGKEWQESGDIDSESLETEYLLLCDL